MDFTWHDGDRTIRFGRGTVLEAPQLIAGRPYGLLTTTRALDAAPRELVESAYIVHRVPPGHVDQVAAGLLGVVDHDVLVAFGGGRVIDTAKALAGARRDRPDSVVVAIPTTLSGAEMSSGHRPPAGTGSWARQVGARIVINDPAIAASQPAPQLAASSANALAHAVEARVTTRAATVPTLRALEAQHLIASAWSTGEDDPGPVARDGLALAALLAGHAVAGASFGISHVMSQTLVRLGGVSHGQANAAVLPVAIEALERRNPGRVDPDGELSALARRLAVLAGADGIRRLGVARPVLDECAAAAAGRAELDQTPPRATEDELRELFAQAW